jgi:hypothetical protein
MSEMTSCGNAESGYGMVGGWVWIILITSFFFFFWHNIIWQYNALYCVKKDKKEAKKKRPKPIKN